LAAELPGAFKFFLFHPLADEDVFCHVLKPLLWSPGRGTRPHLGQASPARGGKKSPSLPFSPFPWREGGRGVRFLFPLPVSGRGLGG
jgi:hypothetical protein